jgi:hypothetical protein
MAMSLENDQGYCPELVYSEQDDDLKGSRNQKITCKAQPVGKIPRGLLGGEDEDAGLPFSCRRDHDLEK